MRDLRGKVLVGLASVSMLGGIALGSVQAFAAFPNTDVQVGFSEDVTPPIVNPTALELRALPSFANFGTLETGAGLTSSATVQGSGYVKLNDGRAPGQEWKVSAKASTLTSGSDVIDDATITINSSGAVQEWTPGATATDPGTIVGPSGVTVNVTAATQLTTNGTTTAEFARAAVSAQEGYAIPITSMQISIPNAPSSYAGKTFTGTVLWTISDTI